MGCLSVSIQKAAVVDISVSAGCENGIDASADCRNAMLMAIATALNVGPDISIQDIRPDIQLNAENRNTKPSVSIYLVCKVDLGGDLYLQVEEGNVITIDGMYMKVMKA